MESPFSLFFGCFLAIIYNVNLKINGIKMRICCIGMHRSKMI